MYNFQFDRVKKQNVEKTQLKKKSKKIKKNYICIYKIKWENDMLDKIDVRMSLVFKNKSNKKM